MAINREVCGHSFEYIRKNIIGDQTSYRFNYPHGCSKMRCIIESFYDALCYIAFVTKVKSTSRMRLNVFFVLVIVGWHRGFFCQARWILLSKFNRMLK